MKCHCIDAKELRGNEAEEGANLWFLDGAVSRGDDIILARGKPPAPKVIPDRGFDFELKYLRNNHRLIPDWNANRMVPF